MAAKKLSILTELTLNAAGFNKGVDGAKEKFNALKGGSEKAASSIKGVFSNMGQMFTPMTSQIAGFTSGISDGIKAFKAMVPAIKSVRTALAATGIGLAVIAISTAFAGLVSWIQRTDEGGDSMRKVFDVIKAVINTILDKLAALGSAIFKLFKGDFKGAGEDAKRAFTGWGNAISSNIDKANKLNAIQDKLEDYNETAGLRAAELEERISELRLKARDEETYNAKERLAFNKQLETAIKQLNTLKMHGFELERQALKTELSQNADNQELRQKYNDKLAEGLRIKAEGNSSLRETIKLNNKLVEQAREFEAIEKDRAFQKETGFSPISPIESKKLDNKGVDNGLVSELTKRQLEEYKKAVFDFQAYNDMLSNSFTSLGENLRLSIGQLGDSLREGANSFKEYAQNLKASVMQIIGNLIGESVAHMIAGQVKFWAKMGPVGLVAAPIAAGAAAGIVKTAFNSLIPKFETGGIVPGNFYSGDRVPVFANSGEMILNRSQQNNLFRMLNNSLADTFNGKVRFEIEGSKLVGILQNHNRYIERGK